MLAHTFARIVLVRSRMVVFLLLLAVLACVTGATHAPAVDSASTLGSALPSHIAEPQQQGIAGFDVEPRSAESHNSGAAPAPLAGDFGHCSANTTSPEGCLTVSLYYQMAIPPPPSSIGWLPDAPRPSHPPLQPMAYHPPSPSPGELSISRT